jgi:hypothetical protein
MYIFPAESTATAAGEFNSAVVARPLSPLKPVTPFPAIVYVIPPVECYALRAIQLDRESSKSRAVVSWFTGPRYNANHSLRDLGHHIIGVVGYVESAGGVDGDITGIT